MKRSGWAAIALILVAVSWGAAFVLMKDAINEQPFYDFLATRFTIATLIMIAVRPQVLRAINGEMLKKGVVLGLLLGGGYITQTIGLEMTTAAITGFITGLYVVLTPLLAWLLLRQSVDRKVIVGVALATIGLGLISITGFSIEVGQLWVVLCALLFAAHIIGLGRWSPGLNSYALTVLQLAVVSALSWVGALVDGYQAPPNGEVWFAVLFTAVFATAIAFFVQTWAQSHMDASRVAIILTSEVVFAAAIAVMVGQEALTVKTLTGGLLIIASMVIAEWPSKRSGIVPLEPLVH
jgi:drug/metabolite transporter (DMT)-like permease